MAKAAQGLGMDVVALAREGASEGICPRIPREQFFAECDVISLHCPLTTETCGIINAETLGMMKSSAFLINTGRGQLVNEHDLAEALKNGDIAGAGLDVLTEEPPSPDHIPRPRHPEPHHHTAHRLGVPRIQGKVARWRSSKYP